MERITESRAVRRREAVRRYYSGYSYDRHGYVVFRQPDFSEPSQPGYTEIVAGPFMSSDLADKWARDLDEADTRPPLSESQP